MTEPIGGVAAAGGGLLGALPSTFLAKVSQTATDRAHAWDAVADVLSPPDAALVERLRSGALVQVWREGSSWLGDDTHMLTAELMSLDVYSRGAARRDPHDDLADLRIGYDALVAPSAHLVDGLRAVAALCREEAQAWTDGRVEEAKALRAGQQDLITERLSSELPDLAGRLVREGEANVWRLVGRLMLAILSTETGRDFQRSVLGDRTRRR